MAKILIVDDDEQIRLMLSDLLKRSGSTVDQASDGEEAINKFNTNHYDLIITDILMPGKEGIQTIQELKKNNPNLKIIAISGGGHIESNVYLDMAKKMGADLCVPKPLDMYNFIDTVKKLLGDEIVS